jgi:hypothetical protein
VTEERREKIRVRRWAGRGKQYAPVPKMAGQWNANWTYYGAHKAYLHAALYLFELCRRGYGF